LLEYLEGRTQTFITTSKESLVEQFVKRANVYRISNGMAEENVRSTELISSTARGAEGI
jgi:hypothetical protein